MTATDRSRMPSARGPRLLPMGDRAVLVEFDGLADVLQAHSALAAARPPGLIDLVPAARTVLAVCDPSRLTTAAARAWLERTLSGPAMRSPHPVGSPAAGEAPIELPIVYDGADLAPLAAELGMPVDELVSEHLAAEWTVAFTGFAPGFAYLVSPQWRHDVPRWASPRTRVPAGAVGLAGEFTGAYPRETPGGWQLIGTTSAPLFDPGSTAPALLTPGARVRFREAAQLPGTPDAPGTPATPAVTSPATPGFWIEEPGLRATIQDQGRPGHRAEGISPSGAMDRAALRTANRLVGNREAAAGIEIVMGGLRATAAADLWVAVAGGWGPVRLNGRAVDPYVAHPWRAGTELHVDWLDHGAHAYLAVRGGIAAAVLAASRATDTLAGLGPRPLRAGDGIPLGDEVAGPPPAAAVSPWGPPADDLIEVPLGAGPRADWFTPDAVGTLYESVWTVSHEVDRVGLRLDGPALTRRRSEELPSEGMVPGSLQVPPSGRPVILGPDAPVTGGYPVIAVVVDAARDLLSQARPGTRVRFRHAP